MANIKEQIIDWFNGPQDYNQGIALLQEVSKKNKVIGKLIRRGDTRDSFEKLVWELNKVAGLKKIPASQVDKTKDKSIKTKEKTAQTPRQETDKSTKLKYNLIGDKDIDSYPPEVNRLVKEYSSLYMQRGKKHAALKRLGDGNDQETVTARQPLIADIKKMSDRMEVLNSAFQGYEKEGFSLDQNILWPEEKAAGNVQQAPGSMETIEELKTKKKNIQSSITKDRNLLTYGGKTKPKDGKEKPVPAGPKRTTLEKRIARKEKEIADLDQRIADLG
jgi:hypothetical protein